MKDQFSIPASSLTLSDKRIAELWAAFPKREPTNPFNINIVECELPEGVLGVWIARSPSDPQFDATKHMAVLTASSSAKATEDKKNAKNTKI